MTSEAWVQRSDAEPTMLDTEPLAASEFGAKPGAAPEALPVASSERYFAVDVLRGFALLGILAMNIVSFGWPWPAYPNPTLGGGFSGLDRGVWFFNHLVFEEKMMTIFSMLFGAGLVLMDQRAEARGARIRQVYYRRVLWLLAIGLVHAYFIWVGDILVLYAECGLLLYLFRNLRPVTLVALGILALSLMVPIGLGWAAYGDGAKAAAKRVEAAKAAGDRPSERDEKTASIWNGGLSKYMAPKPEQLEEVLEKETKAYRGNYRGIVKFRGRS